MVPIEQHMDNYCTDCDYTLGLNQDLCPFCGKEPGMNQGDYHSGPEGYEPSTAYPHTYYGGYGDDREYDDYEDEYR